MQRRYIYTSSFFRCVRNVRRPLASVRWPLAVKWRVGLASGTSNRHAKCLVIKLYVQDKYCSVQIITTGTPGEQLLK